MKKSKEKFEEDRSKKLSHAEKKKLAYWINQNIDLDQLEHLKGNIQRWK
jgi:hypothetical protein